MLEDGLLLDENKTYTVICNGETYTLQPVLFMENLWFMGDYSAINMTESTGEPFLIISDPNMMMGLGVPAAIANVSDNETLTITLLGDYSFIKKIDEKFLPVSPIAFGEGMNSAIVGGVSNNIASGIYSYASGIENKALGTASHAEGGGSVAEGVSAFALGYEVHGIGDYSFATGTNTAALGESSHSEGASDARPFVLNLRVPGSKNVGTVTSWNDDLCIGAACIFNNHSRYITALDEANLTITFNDDFGPGGANGEIEFYVSATAVGDYSHVEGFQSRALGISSHAEGTDTIAFGENQHVQGKFNIADDKSAVIVGNGANVENRSNAHILDFDGNAWFAGDVYVGSTSGTNKDEGSLKLATMADLEAALSGIAIAEEASF